MQYDTLTDQSTEIFFLMFKYNIIGHDLQLVQDSIILRLECLCKDP